MLGVRAYVMARKGVLSSNPDVRNMTKTQWLFEYHSIRKYESMKFKSTYGALRQTLVSVMGLNMIRPTDDQGFPKKIENMTEDEQSAFLPMVAWMAHPDILKKVAEQVQMELGLDQAHSPDTDYEAMVAAIDAAGGDMEPIIGVDVTTAGKVRDPKIEQQKKLLVQPLDVDLDGKA